MSEPIAHFQTPYGPVTLEWRDPVALTPDTSNVMQHSDAEVARLLGSVQAYGLLEFPIYNARTDRLVAGHARREAAINSHLPAIPVLVGHWDPPVAAAMSIAFQGKQYGDWDDDALAETLRALRAAGVDLDEAVFLPPFQIDALLAIAEGAADDPQSSQAGWPLITMAVPPEIKERFDRVLASFPGADYEQLARVLDRAERY